MVEKPEFNIHATPVDLHQYISGKKSEYQLLCLEKEIKFEMTIHDHRKEMKPFSLDKHRVSQILDNIIINSIRFTPFAESVKFIAIVSEQRIEFQVMDSGNGFKNVSRVFDKFYQEDASRSTEKGHSGLGLFIAQSLAKKHGGEIVAGNHTGGGAQVKVVIRELQD